MLVSIFSSRQNIPPSGDNQVIGLEHINTIIIESRSESIKNNEEWGKLTMLMNMPESLSEEKSVILKEVVRRLHNGEEGDVLRGAKEVKDLAKEDSEARTNFTLLGAIPPLVAILDSDDRYFQIDALYALPNLRIGNDI